jgi:hypothetical protein
VITAAAAIMVAVFAAFVLGGDISRICTRSPTRNRQRRATDVEPRHCRR